MVADRQLEELREVHRGTPHAENGAASLDELLQLRKCLGGRVGTLHGLEFLRKRQAAATTAPATATAATAAAATSAAAAGRRRSDA